MWKHNHLVCLRLNENERSTSNETYSQGNVLVVDIPEEEVGMMEETILHELRVPKEVGLSFSDRKIKIILQEVAKYVHTDHQIECVRKHIRQLITTLQAMNSTAERTLKVCKIKN